MRDGEEWRIPFSPERFRGMKATTDMVDADTGEIVVEAGKKITARQARQLAEKGLKAIKATDDDLLGNYLAEDLVNLQTGEIYLEAGDEIDEKTLKVLLSTEPDEIDFLDIDHVNVGGYIRNTLAVDKNESRQDALFDIYRVMRPGEPPTLETAEAMFNSLFFDPERYDLSAVGRVKMNMRLELDCPDTVRVLRKEDILAVVKTLVELRDGKGEIDDIDNLGNRRVRSVGELMENQYRVGLLRMERAIKERMSSIEIDTVMPQDLINAKPAAAAVREFFGSSQLSQFMDQTNPLSEITHKRRLSALGPGGLTRERAGFEVRDVHPTHYGRICPIETPEGPNIGLINSLATFARVNKYGFIETPYRKIIDGKVSHDVVYLSAMEEAKHYVAQANAELDKEGRFTEEFVVCRHAGEVMMAPRENVDLMDVSPKQLVSVAAALIPFLENDDANRALMGSNMQRQAVPLVRAEAPFVGTGMEPVVARDSGAAIARAARRRRRPGGRHPYRHPRHRGSRSRQVGRRYLPADEVPALEPEHLHQPASAGEDVGDRIEKGDIIADGPVDRPRRSGARPQRARRVHALERLQLRGLDPAFGAHRRRRRLHLDPHRGIRGDGARHQARTGRDHARHSERLGRGAEEPRRGRHRLYRRGGAAGRHPGRQDHAEGREPDDAGGKAPARHLRREGVGRSRHLHAHAARNVRHGGRGARLQPPRRGEGRARHGDRARGDRASGQGPRRRAGDSRPQRLFAACRDAGRQGGDCRAEGLQRRARSSSRELLDEYPRSQWWQFAVEAEKVQAELEAMRGQYDESKSALEQRFMDKVEKVQRGDEMPPGVMKMVKVFVAVKRKMQPGDKMAGRHGNKGVVSRIVPVEDMPFLEDGTHVDIVLNPLGVPSRMNVGQILETHLGWACAGMGRQIGELIEAYKENGDIKPLRAKIERVIPDNDRNEPVRRYDDESVVRLAEQMRRGVSIATPVFDGAHESDINDALEMAGLKTSGQSTLYDGRTGESFDRQVTVGYIYMLKLHHLVDDKIHARSIGPYSLVTQQPLGGKAQFGGQRFGEMEVWALEAYGAAYTLQEMLTVKSDDVAGRTKVYEAIVRGDDTFEAGIPESFNVLVKEMRSLGLNVELENTRIEETPLRLPDAAE